MALRFLNGEVSALCLGKPELKWVAGSATISDAVRALKMSGDSYISVWTCDGEDRTDDSCLCVGKFCMADVILFLCREENLADPLKALETPIYDILPKGLAIVRHLEPSSSLLEAIDYILQGTQNLVIPILSRHQINNSSKRSLNRHPSLACSRHSAHECCWLMAEDVVRFLLNSIGVFSPTPTFDIESLNVINREIMTVTNDKPASSALGFLYRALTEQTSVAIIDEENRLMGEISPCALSCCDETAAPAIMALSAMDLMTYIDCGNPPAILVQLVKLRLKERNLGGMVDLMDEYVHTLISSSSSSSSSICSSDDESMSSRNGWLSGSKGSGRDCAGRGCEAIVCSPGSSLLAVMFQALAHRVSCVWVVKENHTLVGTVTFAGMLKCLRSVVE